MKRLLLMACFAGWCFGQQAGPGRMWTVLAEQITSEGHIYHLRGHAEVSDNGLVFHADLIDYDEDNKTMHLAGDVTIEAKGKGSFTADEADYDASSGDLKLKVKLIPVR